MRREGVVTAQVKESKGLLSSVLEMRHLRTLQQLRRCGSLVEAAEALCVTQSALSHQLKDLETRLNARLFVRKSRPLRFTETGAKLLQLADQVLAQVLSTERDLHRLQLGQAGRLHMAIECHSCFNWLMPTIEGFRQQWPSVELDFSAGFTFEPLPALQAGDIDLVITSDPQKLEGVTYEPLFRYEMLIACGNAHALAGKPVWQPEDLRLETVLTYPVSHTRLDLFKYFLTPAGIEPQRLRTTELTLMMVQLAASGLGVCALPNWVLEDYRRQGFVSIASAGVEGVWPTLYIALRQESLEREYIQVFLQMARRQCFQTLEGILPAHSGG